MDRTCDGELRLTELSPAADLCSLVIQAPQGQLCGQLFASRFHFLVDTLSDVLPESLLVVPLLQLFKSFTGRSDDRSCGTEVNGDLPLLTVATS